MSYTPESLTRALQDALHNEEITFPADDPSSPINTNEGVWQFTLDLTTIFKQNALQILDELITNPDQVDQDTVAYFFENGESSDIHKNALLLETYATVNHLEQENAAVIYA